MFAGGTVVLDKGDAVAVENSMALERIGFDALVIMAVLDRIAADADPENKAAFENCAVRADKMVHGRAVVQPMETVVQSLVAVVDREALDKIADAVDAESMAVRDKMFLAHTVLSQREEVDPENRLANPSVDLVTPEAT